MSVADLAAEFKNTVVRSQMILLSVGSRSLQVHLSRKACGWQIECFEVVIPDIGSIGGAGCKAPCREDWTEFIFGVRRIIDAARTKIRASPGEISAAVSSGG